MGGLGGEVRQNQIADKTSCCLLNDFIPIDWQFESIIGTGTDVDFYYDWVFLYILDHVFIHQPLGPTTNVFFSILVSLSFETFNPTVI